MLAFAFVAWLGVSATAVAQFSLDGRTQAGESLPDSQLPVPVLPIPQADSPNTSAGNRGTAGRAAVETNNQAVQGVAPPTPMATPMLLVPAQPYAQPVVPPGAGPQYYSTPSPVTGAIPGNGTTVWPPQGVLPQQVPGLIPQSGQGGYSIPVGPEPPNGPLEVASQSHGQVVTVLAQDVDLRLVLANLAQESRVNIVVAENVTGRVTTSLRDVPLWHALDAILKVNGLVWSQQGEIIFVNRPNLLASPSAGSMPGQVLQVYDLNYVAAVEVLEVVKGLLSPAGRAFTHSADTASSRHTRERLVVEDYSDRLHKIALYLQSVDTPPRQVLIEANVLQVTLGNDNRHGVNLKALAKMRGAHVDFESKGFAEDQSNPGFTLGLDGNDLDALLECLKSSSKVRTLASPKVLCVNGQEARMQIGSKFGYFVTTTTQTSTLQNVNFLDIGVVLRVKPIIADDDKVLLTVEPKVSGGRINPTSKLPEEDTTEATTTVLLPDGRGMVIGGLIKEVDNESRSWIPWIGEKRFIGKLFSKAGFKKERVEVIIALTPHIVPYGDPIHYREAEQYTRASGLPADWDSGLSPELSGLPYELDSVVVEESHVVAPIERVPTNPSTRRDEPRSEAPRPHVPSSNVPLRSPPHQAVSPQNAAPHLSRPREVAPTESVPAEELHIEDRPREDSPVEIAPVEEAPVGAAPAEIKPANYSSRRRAK